MRIILVCMGLESFRMRINTDRLRFLPFRMRINTDRRRLLAFRMRITVFCFCIIALCVRISSGRGPPFPFCMAIIAFCIRFCAFRMGIISDRCIIIIIIKHFTASFRKAYKNRCKIPCCTVCTC